MVNIKMNTWLNPESVLDPLVKRIEELWNKWRRDCDEKTRETCEMVDNGFNPDDIQIQASLYSRKKIKSHYFMNKNGPFRGKCVYCESFITDFQRGDIEHFRPKGKVTDEEDNPIHISDRDNNEREHWGYYWLAYSDKNLMPACQLCNQPSDEKLGKRSRFPLENESARACYHDDDTDSENPLLINPLDPDDDPEEHLFVDPETGVMGAKTPRGEACIKIFGLNKREQLITERRRAAELVRLFWQDPKKNKNILRKILIDAVEPHTLASRCTFRKLMKEASEIGL